MHKTIIGIIGAGNMGAAIISGIRRHYPLHVCEADKKRRRYLQQKFHLTAEDLRTVVSKSRVIILAVKPQNFEEVLGTLRWYVRQDQLIISIAAGVTCRYVEQRLGKKIHVVRTMPNLPAQVGEGMTAICQGRFATTADIKTAGQILNFIGETIVIHERLMDAITAVSGSGPAYVFLFVECLTKAAQALGIKGNISRTLVAQTLKGSLALLEATQEPAEVLRQKVTSKGGTTQAAMDVFKKHRIERIFVEALKAAQKRAEKLAK